MTDQPPPAQPSKRPAADVPKGPERNRPAERRDDEARGAHGPQHATYGTIAAVIFAAVTLMAQGAVGVWLAGLGLAATLAAWRFMQGGRWRDTPLWVGAFFALVFGSLALAHTGGGSSPAVGTQTPTPDASSTPAQSPGPRPTTATTPTATQTTTPTPKPRPTPAPGRVAKTNTIAFGLTDSLLGLDVSLGAWTLLDAGTGVTYVRLAPALDAPCPRRYRKVVAGDRFQVLAGANKYTVVINYVSNESVQFEVVRQRRARRQTLACRRL